jgi:hypothetical protein
MVFDLAILGSGPVGAIAALGAAQRGLSVVLCAAPPAHEGPERLELVPGQLLHLLLQMGVHPKWAGVMDCAVERRVAWETRAPIGRPGPRTVAVWREALEGALGRGLAREPRIARIESGPTPPIWTPNRWQGHGWSAGRLLDATGRAAVMATTRWRWPRVAWHWHASGNGGVDSWFGLAALPWGYAYRCRLADIDTFGLLLSGAKAHGPDEACATVAEADAQWIVEGFDWAGAVAVAPVAAGPQRAESQSLDPCVAVGDAHIARDPLSSQGLLVGMTEALGALAAWDDAPMWARGLRSRQAVAWERHRRHLQALIDMCRFRDAPGWQAYRHWLDAPAAHRCHGAFGAQAEAPARS